MTSIDGLSGNSQNITISDSVNPKLTLLNGASSGNINYTNSSKILQLTSDTKSANLDATNNAFYPSTNLLMDLGRTGSQWANILGGSVIGSVLVSGGRVQSTSSTAGQNAASPGITHTDDAKSGMFFELDSDHCVGFSSNGVQKAFVNVNGFGIDDTLLFPDGATEGKISYADSTKTLRFVTNSTGLDFESGSNISLHPQVDNSMALGLSDKRYSIAFTTLGLQTSNTSLPVLCNNLDQDTGIVLPADNTMIVKAANVNSCLFSANGITSTVQPFIFMRNVGGQVCANNISAIVNFSDTIQSQGSTITNVGGVYSVTQDGIYHISYKIYMFGNGVSTGQRISGISVSSLLNSSLGRRQINGSGVSLTVGGSATVKLVSTDTFSILFFQSSGGDLTIGDASTIQLMNEISILKIC